VGEEFEDANGEAEPVVTAFGELEIGDDPDPVEVEVAGVAVSSR
jgi:hypothetical protein